jgi:RNA polymerase sigma-70 factor (ECF subfamily)
MEAFDRIYDMYKEDFIESAAFKFRYVPREDLIDAWQDTVISFFEQVRSDKLHTLTCSLRSFLFLLGYRYIIKYKRHYLKESATGSFEENTMLEVENIELEEPWNEEKEMLQTAVQELPEQSRRMLILRYIQEMSIEEIMVEMKYSSANAVSVTLSRNLKRLKDIIAQKHQFRK